MRLTVGVKACSFHVVNTAKGTEGVKKVESKEALVMVAFDDVDGGVPLIEIGSGRH